jgi:hypothetical protein
LATPSCSALSSRNTSIAHRSTGEFRAEGDALFAEADELRRFQECAVILKPKSTLCRPTSGTGTGSTCRNGCLGLVDRRDHRP